MMEIITIECPKCKGELLFKEGTEKFFCMYCRNEVVIKKSEPEHAEVVMKSVNHEFQAKLAIAKHNEELYRQDQMTFDKVMESYDEVRTIGAHHWEYWYARAEFFVEGGLREVQERAHITVLSSRKAFINTYILWMDNALKHAGNNTNELKEKKEKKLEKIESELANIKEHNPTSNEPFEPGSFIKSANGCGTALGIIIVVIIILYAIVS